MLSEVVAANLDKEWVIMNKVERSIFEKINKHKALKDWDIQINFGIKTGFNEAFIIDEETKNKLIKEDKKSAELIKPLIRGRDIKRYSYDFNGVYLINTHNGIERKNIPPVNINKYKAIKKHLDKYYSQLVNRQDKGDTPYNLRSCAYLDNFDKYKIKNNNGKIEYYGKIMWNRISSELYFSYDDKGYFVLDSMFMINCENKNIIKYLIGILNSKLSRLYIKLTSATLGSGTYGAKIYIEKIPIPKIDNTNKKLVDKIISNVNEILKVRNKNSSENVSKIEKEIDKLTYKLYNLSNEEIEIIEES